MDHQKKKERKLNKQKICCNITTVCPLSPLFPKLLRMISLFLGLEVVGVKSGLDSSLFLEEPGETGRAGAGHRDMHGLTHTHTLTPPHAHSSPHPNPFIVACPTSVRRRQTRANGRTVETGHDGVLTAVPRIVIGTPDGGKTGHQVGEGAGTRGRDGVV